MKQRLPLVISVTALTVALVGSTPLGQAAESVLDQIVPRAKRADLAANAVSSTDTGRRSIPSPVRSRSSARRASSPSIGAVGPQGPPGQQGPPGPRGASEYLRYREHHRPRRNGHAGLRRQLPRPVGTRRGVLVQVDTDALFVFESHPASDSVWRFKVSNETGGNKPMTLYAVCANVS